MKSQSSGSGGIGFVGALQIAFIVLKLTGFISWSWPLVLAPALISLCLFVSLVALVIALGGIE